MLPGDEPTKSYMADQDLFIVADASTKKPGTHKLTDLIQRLRASLEEATSEDAGLMTAVDKAKLDSLQTAETINKISTHARREHVGLVVRIGANGKIRMFRNLRDKGRIIRAYAETEAGTFNLTVKIDGLIVSGLNNVLVDPDSTGLVSIFENNTVNTLSVVEAIVSNASINPAPTNVTLFLLVEYDV